MKLFLSLFIAAIVAVDAFGPSSIKQSRRTTTLFVRKKTPFFLSDEDPPKKPTPPKTPPPIKKQKRDMTPRPTISLQPMLNEIKKEIVDPLLSGDIEKGVSPDAIKGAALTGSALTLLAGQSLPIVAGTGLGAAYVALSPGLGGKAVREIGGAAWESATAAMKLYEKYGMGEVVARATKNVVEESIKVIQRQQQQQQKGGIFQKEEEVEEKVDVSVPYDAAARLAFQETGLAETEYPKFREDYEQEQAAEVARKSLEAKRKMEKAKKDKAHKEELAKAKKEQEARLKAEREQAKKEEEARVKAEQEAEKARIARAKEEEEARIAAAEMEAEKARLKAEREQAKKQEEARVKAEQEAEKARIARAKAKEEEEARIAAAEMEAEKARLAEQMKREDEARLAEEARKRDEARLAEEQKLKGDIAVEEDDDLEATIRLAEQILDGTIAGLEDAIADDNAKEEWDSAGKLAQDLGVKTSDDDEEDDDDEQSMAVLAQAAREAVEKFEEEMKTQDAAKAKQKELWDSEMITDDDFDYDEDLEELREEYDEEEDEDMEELEDDLGIQDDIGAGDVDLEELGRQARAAVEQFESNVVEENEMADNVETSVTDWSKFTVAQLKDELRSRGLKTTGRKADLVATLTTDDLESQVEKETAYFDSKVQREETGEGIMWEANPIEEPTIEDLVASSSDEPDMEEIARAAREAVELFEQQEAEEIEMDSDVEYEAMTVNELKDELRNRGLKVSGRKAELIERLRSS